MKMMKSQLTTILLLPFFLSLHCVVGVDDGTNANDNIGTTIASESDSSLLSETDPPLTQQQEYDPKSPLVYCSYLPLEFLNCTAPEDLKGNTTRLNELGYGCVQWGGEKHEDVQKTSAWCTVLPGIECYGNRTFLKPGFPCITYNGHYFVTTLIYSVLLGFLGIDRFCLGHTGTAVGKLLTLGGFGVWWIIDVVLLVTGQLSPADKSNWIPYY